MRAVYNALVAAAGISVLAACTSGQSAVEPPSTPTNIQSTTALQFRVGTYRTSGGSVFFNTVVTYRQQNGLSGTLDNTPTITGPAGFVVPTIAAAGTDAGTNHISGTPPTQPGTPAVATTFNQVGGAYAYGFAPANNNINGQANYINALGLGNGGGFGCNICNANGFALYNYYSSPYLVASGSGGRTPWVLGPPAVPDFHNGTFPNGFLGYDSGFVAFAVPNPPAGAYNLHLTVPGPTIGVNSAVFDAPATLTNATPLAPEAAVVSITRVGLAYGPSCPPPPPATAPMCGGAQFVVAPAAPGITNQLLYVVDINGTSGAPTFYTINAGAAGGTFVLSPTSGPTSPQGVHGAPFTQGDNVYAYVVGSDYDILAAAPPLNTQQLPALPAQADVSVGPGATAPFAY
ncbi:MAG: hypothetical protein M3N49_01705 [Candidatus Eremiobacteraeota bacterium]|nr:hypothetical protein [Candidatus Eremiobacteraeota bacterium]